MHQIFYIDIDEEITSVIDRLRKSNSAENFFVVSPRALILHSVVSLKLLRKEAESQKKQIAIVVNDDAAKTKVEKAGILVLQSLKGLEGEEVKENFGVKVETKTDNKNSFNNDMGKTNKKSRLQKIGSDDFYEEKEESSNKTFSGEENFGNMRIGKSDLGDVSQPKEVLKTEFPRPAIETPLAAKNMDVKKDLSFSYSPEKNFEEMPALMKKDYSPQNHFGSPSFDQPNFGQPKNNVEMDPYKEKLVEGFFDPSKKMNNFGKVKNFQKTKSIVSEKSGGFKKIILSFIVICFILAALAGSYFYLPGAKISILTKSNVKKVDLSIKGDSNVSEIKVDSLVVPARIVEKEDTFSFSFNATGSKSSSSDSNQKSKGKVTIYNEYGKESQQLVATTRLISTDGKLFRLVKNVTVPGMTDSNPGTVEADVIADQTGSEYNISAADFKIPGFEGSSKYEKFYAKSTESMSGGGQGSSSGVTIVSQNDLDKAKKESESKLKDQIIEKLKGEMGSGQVFITEASELSVSESSASSKLNEVASNFDYKIKGRLKAIVFSENDIKKVISENSKIDISSLKLTYGTSMPDFGSGTITIKVGAETISKSDTNWDEFKKQILGKDEKQIREILKQYPQIEKINIDFWPKFMTQKIPQYESRVQIEASNSEQ